MISKALQLEILQRAIESASAGSQDAGTHTYSTKEKFQLNEQWCQSYVGFSINDFLRHKFQEADNFVTFETSIGWLKGFANNGAVKGRPPAAFSSRGRFDLVVWDDKGRPSGVVEIKDTSVLQPYALEKDCDKIKSAIDKLDTIKWGIFLFSVRASAGRVGNGIAGQLTQKKEKIVDYISDKYADYYLRNASSKAEDIDDCRVMWTGVIFQNRRSKDG